MARQLILLLRLAAAICLVGAAIAIAGAVMLFVEWRNGPGFGTGLIGAGGLVLVGVALGLFPGLTLWRASAALRAAGPGLPVASGRLRGASSVLTAVVAVGWLVGAVLVVAAGHANLMILAVHLSIGLIGATAAWTARYVPDRASARPLLYVAVIGAILVGLLGWAYGRG